MTVLSLHHIEHAVIQTTGALTDSLQAKGLDNKQIERLTRRYLEFLVNRYRYLDFRGMGMADRVALRLPLTEMYMPLTARIELPAGETWARELRIEDFVSKWTVALEQAVLSTSEEALRNAGVEKAALLESVAHNPGVRRRASNPLLLTILALMKRQGHALPERRVELYEKYVATLLRHWNLARSLDGRSGRES